MIETIDEGNKRRCRICKRLIHKDEILIYGCLICNEEEKAMIEKELI